MAQITEDYISYETAKLLKEKGFEYNPDESYWLIDADNKMYWISRIGAYDYVDAPTESFQRPKNGYRLMTQAMAMKWLREVHNYSISICLDSYVEPYDNEYYILIRRKKDRFEEISPCEQVYFKTYEEACEAAIKYCLEKLI